VLSNTFDHAVAHTRAAHGNRTAARVSFATDGFLSPTMDRFRASLKNVAAYKAWFDYKGLSRIWLTARISVTNGYGNHLHDRQQPTLAPGA
jgi:hypothetical protein